jgi:hypothetical protein
VAGRHGRAAPAGGSQVAADQVGQLVDPRPAHVGHQAGRRSEGELGQPGRHLAGIDRLEPPPGRDRDTGSLASPRTVSRVRSWNWVARRVVQGTPEPAISRSAASLAAKWPNIARSTALVTGIRSAPTTEMHTRCRVPAREAALTRWRALTSSPLGVPARCTISSASSAAASTPRRWPVAGHALDPLGVLAAVAAEHPDLTPGVQQPRDDQPPPGCRCRR